MSAVLLCSPRSSVYDNVSVEYEGDGNARKMNEWINALLIRQRDNVSIKMQIMVGSINTCPASWFASCNMYNYCVNERSRLHVKSRQKKWALNSFSRSFCSVPLKLIAVSLCYFFFSDRFVRDHFVSSGDYFGDEAKPSLWFVHSPLGGSHCQHTRRNQTRGRTSQSWP